MFRYFSNCTIMHRNAAVISVTCILLCFTLNYTFPLHRKSSEWESGSYSNLSGICDKSRRHEILERTKKMASNFGGAMKRLKDSTQDFSKNVQARFNSVMNAFSEDDLRQYEQLVIMKKNPYLDLKDIEQKFSPKNVRHSQKFETGPLPQNTNGDPSIWESVEEGPNVEIINRGLTGFGIPAKIVKNTLKLTQSNSKLNSVKSSPDIPIKQNMKISKTADVLGSPRDDAVFLSHSYVKNVV